MYCRISDDPSGLALGVERQRADCVALAERLGWIIAEIYTDNDVSAFSGKPRPAYLRMLADIKDGSRDGLVFYHPDRLHRSPKELELFIDIVQEVGIPLASVSSGDYDLSTASGRMTARVLGAFARGESERISERVKRKHVELRANGLFQGGRRAFGLTDRREALVDDEAELVRQAARHVLSGKSMSQVVNEWNAEGVTTTHGRAWTVSGLKMLLLSNWSRGLTTSGNAATWPAMIDAATANRLDLLLNDPSRRLARPGRERHLLSGIARCARCGEPMGFSNTNGNRGYGCRNRAAGCWSRVRADWLEDDVVKRLMARLDPAIVGQGAVVPQAEDHAIAELEALQARADELADMLADGDLDRNGFRRAMDRVTRRRETLRNHVRRQAEIESARQVRAEAFDLFAEWRELSTAKRRQVLTAFVERVDVAAAVKGRAYYDPDRVTVVWRG